LIHRAVLRSDSLGVFSQRYAFDWTPGRTYRLIFLKVKNHINWILRLFSQIFTASLLSLAKHRYPLMCLWYPSQRLPTARSRNDTSGSHTRVKRGKLRKRREVYFPACRARKIAHSIFLEDQFCVQQVSTIFRRAAWKGLGEAESVEGVLRKKEEFPGIMGYLRPGNSFPQICVVSVS